MINYNHVNYLFRLSCGGGRTRNPAKEQRHGAGPGTRSRPSAHSRLSRARATGEINKSRNSIRLARPQPPTPVESPRCTHQPPPTHPQAQHTSQFSPTQSHAGPGWGKTASALTPLPWLSPRDRPTHAPPPPCPGPDSIAILLIHPPLPPSHSSHRAHIPPHPTTLSPGEAVPRESSGCTAELPRLSRGSAHVATMASKGRRSATGEEGREAWSRPGMGIGFRVRAGVRVRVRVSRGGTRGEPWQPRSGSAPSG